jgi:hypothetical protein
MVEKVNSKIISIVQSENYFSVTADCTPDIIHLEQLSVTVRYVDVTNENNDNEICERFLAFTSTDDFSGKGLTDVILKFLEKNKLELKHCRGQGYNNAANIKGKIIVYKMKF